MTVAALETNVRRVLDRVARAAERSGRSPEAVAVVAVTKTVGRAAVDEAYALGLRQFGENRVQDARAKFSDPLPDDARLHLIGYLQTNKARDAVALFDMVQSVDRPSLIDALQRRAAQVGKTLDVLVQVNVARESQKHGCAPEDALDVVRRAAAQPNLRVRGLMTIAPLVSDPEEVRWVFRDLRLLRDRLAETLQDVDLGVLSMGMTNDFEVAIEEGATMVRVGRAIFEPERGS